MLILIFPSHVWAKADHYTLQNMGKLTAIETQKVVSLSPYSGHQETLMSSSGLRGQGGELSLQVPGTSRAQGPRPWPTPGCTLTRLP